MGARPPRLAPPHPSAAARRVGRYAALAVILCGAGSAAADDIYQPSHIQSERPGVETSFPLVQQARIYLPIDQGPLDVKVCAGWSCSLYLSHPFDPAQGDSIVVEQHPPFGPVFLGEHYTARYPYTASVSNRSPGMHAVALYGGLAHAPPRATLVTGPADRMAPTGGIAPAEATAALDDVPELALAFSAVVLAPGAVPDDDLLRALDRLVRIGGVVVVPRSSSDSVGGLVGAVALEPLVPDPSTRMVELGSHRVLVEGERSLAAEIARRDGGAVVVYDDEQLGPTLLADALLAAAPRFSASPRVGYSGVRQTPASAAAALGVGRALHGSRLLWPLAIALLLLGVAVRARRSGALVTRTSLALGVGSAVVFLLVPMIGDDGDRLEVRSYVSWGDATLAFEEGAIAARPSWRGDELTFTGPAGVVLAPELRGVGTSRPQRVAVLDGGRTVRFTAAGDAVGVASWLRPVELPGLSVTSPDGGWPTLIDEVVVESRLPFALEEVHAWNGASEARGGPVVAGARVTLKSGVLVEPPEVDGSDPRELAKRRLLQDLRSRCQGYGMVPPVVSCVYGVGTAPDGALVGVQVLSR